MVLGADGHLGRLATDLLRAGDVPVRTVDRGAVPEDLDTDEVVVNLASSAPEVVVPWAAAGSRAGGYLDAAPTDVTHRLVGEQALGPAPVVPGAGMAAAVADALAVVAGERLVGPDRVDVTLYVPSRRSLLATATPRERGELLDAVLAPMEVLVDGTLVRERVAEARRLAWFPRPVGPHHAAAVPGPHRHTIPRVMPTVGTVRTGLALRSSSAELLQAVAGLARFDPVRRAVARRADRGGRRAGTTEERWALVVEVATPGGRLVRAWAYGHDRHGVTARVVASVAPRLLLADAGDGRPRGVTEVVPAEQLLDTLAAHTDLRWSITGPVDV